MFCRAARRRPLSSGKVISAMATRGEVDISVVIPAYNSRATIVQCLEALARQDFSGRYEVIVVDSSSDGTAELVNRRFPSVRLIHLEQRALPGRARNRGVAEARGAVVAFTDADCLPEPDWLRRHYEAQHEYEVVGGALANANPASLVGWASYLLEFSGYTPSRRQGVTGCLVTANLSCRRKLCREFPFAEDLWAGEDRVFTHTLSRGRRLLFDGRIRVKHLNRENWREFTTQQRRSGRGATRAWARIGLHPRLRRHPCLALLTPGWRLAVTFYRVGRDTPVYLVPALGSWPLLLGGSLHWAFAFLREQARERAP